MATTWEESLIEEANDIIASYIHQNFSNVVVIQNFTFKYWISDNIHIDIYDELVNPAAILSVRAKYAIMETVVTDIKNLTGQTL